MIRRKQGHLNRGLVSPLIASLKMIHATTNVKVSRDSDDDKFINCAIDANAMYIISGDNDLLVIKQYDAIQIITAKEFCNKYLHD